MIPIPIIQMKSQTYFLPAISESNELMDALASCKMGQIWAAVINSFSDFIIQQSEIWQLYLT